MSNSYSLGVGSSSLTKSERKVSPLLRDVVAVPHDLDDRRNRRAAESALIDLGSQDGPQDYR